MSTKLFHGRTLVEGTAAGQAIISRKAFTFAHGVDPSNGDVTDPHSDIRGESVKGKIIIYPYGKGSTTASSWFLETVRRGNGPAAIVTESVDLSAVIGSVMSRLVYKKEIPVLAGFKISSFQGIATAEASVSGDKAELRLDS